MSEINGVLRVPEQSLPVPPSLSPEARGFLAGMIARNGVDDAPNGDQGMEADRAIQMLAPGAARFNGTFETFDLGNGAALYRAAPEDAVGRLAAVAYFDIHGGGFVAGGGEMCRLLARIRAADYGAQVFSVDYRLAPAHPYPAALDDCMAAYRLVLDRVPATDIVLGGSSAGGNLAAALVLRARDEGLPLPAALLLSTPALEMDNSGDSRTVNRLLDVSLLGGAGEGPDSYVGAADPLQPYLSPLYAEIGPEWPPTMLTTGTRDLLLSDSVRMHRKLREVGVDARLYVTEAGLHIGFMGMAPEDRFIMQEGRRFVRQAWGVAG